MRIAVSILTFLCTLGLVATALAQPRPKKAEVVINDDTMSTTERIAQKFAMAEAVMANGYDSLDFEEARNLVREAIAIDPERASTYWEAAVFHRNFLSDYTESLVLIEAYIERADASDIFWLDAHIELGRSKYFENSPTSILEAEAHLLVAYNEMMDSGVSWRLGDVETFLGHIAMSRRDPPTAVRYYKSSMTHMPSDPQAVTFFLARALLLDHKAEEALSMYEGYLDGELAQINGMDPSRIYDTLQMIHTALGNYDTALQYLEAWERSMQVGHTLAGSSAEMASIHNARASVYFTMGDYAEAEAQYRRALENELENPTFLNNVAWAIVVQAEFGDPRLEEALRFAERAVELDPSAAYLDTLAEVLFRLHRYEDAIAAIDDAIALVPTEPYLIEQRTKFERSLAGNPWQGTGNIRRIERWTPPNALGL